MEKFPEQMANLRVAIKKLEDGTFEFRHTVDPAEEMKVHKGPYNKAELDATCRLLKDLLDL